MPRRRSCPGDPVVTFPEASMAQPSGIGFRFRARSRSCRKRLRLVAMSMTIGGSSLPGKAIAIGLVPSIRSADPTGATSLVEFVMAQPMRSRSGPGADNTPRCRSGSDVTLTHPEPTASAFSMAIRFAQGPTTSPSPLSPSTVAVPGNWRTIRTSGRGLMRPRMSTSK